MQLDCTDEDSIANAASQVSGAHKHLDLLLNVAGILHVPGKMSPGQLQRQLLLSMTMLDCQLSRRILVHVLLLSEQHGRCMRQVRERRCATCACHGLHSTFCVGHAETALSRVNAESLLTNFQINALGPILVSKASSPSIPNGWESSMLMLWQTISPSCIRRSFQSLGK